MPRFALVSLLSIILLDVGLPSRDSRAEEVIPHHQSSPPGPAVEAEEAARRMTVPEGFRVEVVAAEPDLVNPVAMTIDERGRFWVCESVEYPRRTPGKGRDRVVILEDTDGDGRVDMRTVFAEGLNIPSGIALGYGGVWVANAPDLLFLQDTNGDDRADRRQTIVTGFGRTDTHELPNSLTWGPDGWLYGLNGVFNHCDIEQDGKRFKFNCAMFRIHPRTHEFQLFAEGTSNPWGIAFDPLGSSFVSACVIDHLWHIVEGGYYHRQAGPYPANTWRIESIVEHKHQMAAYCGLEYFDSDTFPEQYRDRLLMGNIHGGCINVDRLERRGAGYRATGEDDFLTANDAWFMPIDQQTGPDGSLYVLDWYDRYHCYQDARRDPEGIERLRGRLYRVRYGDTPRAEPFDLAKESNEQLIDRLSSGNIYYRATAQRLLQERELSSDDRKRLQALVLDPKTNLKPRMHALFSLVGNGSLEVGFHEKLLESNNADLRAWGVRAAGNQQELEETLVAKIGSLAGDEAPQVRLQVVTAADKLSKGEPGSVDALELLAAAVTTGDDPLVAQVIWRRLQPHLAGTGASRWLAKLERRPLAPGTKRMMPHLIEQILSQAGDDPRDVVALFELVAHGKSRDPASIERLLDALAARRESGEITPERIAKWRPSLVAPVTAWLARESSEPLKKRGALFAAAWNLQAQDGELMRTFLDAEQPYELRLKAFEAMSLGPQMRERIEKQAKSPADDAGTIRALLTNANDRSEQAVAFRSGLVDALGGIDSPAVATLLLDVYPRCAPELQPRIVATLVARDMWGQPLIEAVAQEIVPRAALNSNQLRTLAASDDESLRSEVRKLFGEIRTTRDPNREKVIAEIRQTIVETPGDPHRGLAVFRKVCGQCHKLHGEGHEVGPDISVNGRSSFEQLLSNVFDPNLVIGPDYQSVTVVTLDGKILTGLMVEQTERRVVLKVEGGEQEVVPAAQIDELVKNPLSLMPEGLEKQFTPQELADLFALLTLDKPPTDSTARPIPGTPIRQR